MISEAESVGRSLTPNEKCFRVEEESLGRSVTPNGKCGRMNQEPAASALLEAWLRCRGELEASVADILRRHDTRVMQLLQEDATSELFSSPDRAKSELQASASPHQHLGDAVRDAMQSNSLAVLACKPRGAAPTIKPSEPKPSDIPPEPSPKHGSEASMDVRKSSSVASITSWEAGNFMGIPSTLIGFVVENARKFADLHEPERTGPLARVIFSSVFKTICILVIVFNAIVTFVAANEMVKTWNDTPSETLVALERFFLGFYIVELAMRIGVHRFFFFLNDEMGWNTFDLFLVLVSGWPYFIMAIGGDSVINVNLGFLRVLRVMKVTRVLRLLRVIRFFRELRVMLDATLASAPTLFWCFVLLFITVSMFALVFVQLVTEYLIENGYDVCPGGPDSDGCEIMDMFGSIQGTMLSLYMATTGGNDWHVYYNELKRTGPTASALFLFFLAFYIFGLFNLLTGMFVDKAMAASQVDSDMDMFENRLKEERFLKFLKKICKEFDVDADGSFSDDEFQVMMMQGRLPSMISSELGLDMQDMQMMYEMLRETHEKIPIETFLKGCMRMRGAATSIDMQTLLFETRQLRKHTTQIRSLLGENGPEPC